MQTGSHSANSRILPAVSISHIKFNIVFSRPTSEAVATLLQDESMKTTTETEALLECPTEF
jgi:hypothetical protein